MKKEKRCFVTGIFNVLLFVIWTILIQKVDVKIVGETATEVGFATLNSWFHQLTGVHLWLYNVTDWLGLIPIFVCFAFAVLGFAQLIKQKNLFKVDKDILILGIYYILVIFCYLIFEMIPINYRPIFIEGRREVSYPSSTTLLILSVIPTLIFQCRRRMKNQMRIKLIEGLSYVFLLFMVFGRLISGVHWLTDIVGAIFLSFGLYRLYIAIVLWSDIK